MKRLVILVTISALALGCGDSSNDAQTVELDFAAVVGEEAFVCGDSYDNLGANDTTLALSDFRFYVQDIALKNAAGNWVPVTLEENIFQTSGIALLDFEDGCGDFGNPDLNDVVTGSVPAGDYDGLRFKMGVPFEMNHVNSATGAEPDERHLDVLELAGRLQVPPHRLGAVQLGRLAPAPRQHWL